ncbi:MAG: hypothetical protein V2A72_02700 [Candidatus Omnitrophota bacterium]
MKILRLMLIGLMVISTLYTATCFAGTTPLMATEYLYQDIENGTFDGKFSIIEYSGEVVGGKIAYVFLCEGSVVGSPETKFILRFKKEDLDEKAQEVVLQAINLSRPVHLIILDGSIMRIEVMLNEE